jgi:hypothetical protein
MPVALFQPFVDLCQGERRIGAGNGETSLVYEVSPPPRTVFGAEVALYSTPVL